MGEAIIGKREAERRVDMIVGLMKRPEITYVSVKISAVCANISALAFDETVHAASEPMRRIYRAAHAHNVFVNLDMEEYRDLHLTVAVFKKLLSEPEFNMLPAGIVLQAYLPDSHRVATELSEWAILRRSTGGAPIKIRVVKGANLAMERVEAELRGWPQAPYATKAETDASYKSMLDRLLVPRFDDAVRVGIASHNLFDISWATGLIDRLAERGAAGRVDLEMLEGMAPAQANAVAQYVSTRRGTSVLMYTPVVGDDDFVAAIAYLVRRLDENTTPENYLRHVFEIAPGNAVFAAEAARFTAAVGNRDHVSTAPRRTQNRSQPAELRSIDEPFANEADTDFTLAANRTWAHQHLANAVTMSNPPWATIADVNTALGLSVAGQVKWAQRPMHERAGIIDTVGTVVADRRGEIIAAMCHETSKTVAEGDPEVSEAVDFAHYYARRTFDIVRLEAEGLLGQPLGVVVVAPPWNFPFAIALGGVLAALAAGNSVVLKPAPQALTVARLVVDCCWAAGVPHDALTYLPCNDDEVGRSLIEHRNVNAVILTGARATAGMFLDWKPSLRLHAETSGKTSLVISASADVDLALRDLVRSAFGHAGQKCSAASLAIVDRTLYDDSHFLERLRDAAETLVTGPATSLGTDIPPLIGQPGETLKRALTTLDPGESWLLEPRCLSDDGRLWSPGIRLGVVNGSWFHHTECFGPVLGVMRAESPDDAIRLQNSVDYGLTAGLHALDPEEIDRWIHRVEAGNLYVNRGITGAIVQRQPFGGWKQSVVGPTSKAGGAHYVNSLIRWTDPRTDRDLPETNARFNRGQPTK
jgi:RHH-type transcriptional regulator, proline utilization regulon repressor / proline dehydrogenase / delta 1-pyrroline-5-carboxylate dehydrogenase